MGFQSFDMLCQTAGVGMVLSGGTMSLRGLFLLYFACPAVPMQHLPRQPRTCMRSPFSELAQRHSACMPHFIPPCVAISWTTLTLKMPWHRRRQVCTGPVIRFIIHLMHSFCCNTGGNISASRVDQSPSSAGFAWVWRVTHRKVLQCMSAQCTRALFYLAQVYRVLKTLNVSHTSLQIGTEARKMQRACSERRLLKRAPKNVQATLSLCVRST